MKKNKLPFQIGKHYENWEFALEFSDEEKIKGFDSYFYIWEIVFLTIVPKYVELIFCLDILNVVIMTIDFETIDQLQKFRDILDAKFGNKTQFQNEYLNAEIYQLLGLELWLVYIPDGYRIELSYGINKYLNIIYN